VVSVVGYRAPDGPTGAPLRNPQTGAIIGDSPFMSGLIVLVMLVFLAIEAAYGSGAKTITSMVDGINAVTKTFAGLSGLVFLRDTEVGASRANLRTALYETGCRPRGGDGGLSGGRLTAQHCHPVDALLRADRRLCSALR
jgi:hypothetical protein